MLKLSTTNNTIKLYVRPYSSSGNTDVTIEDEELNTVENVLNATATYTVESVTLDLTAQTFQENHNYKLTIKKDGAVICQTKAFCTDEASYKISEGEYVTSSSNDYEYITPNE